MRRDRPCRLPNPRTQATARTMQEQANSRKEQSARMAKLNHSTQPGHWPSWLQQSTVQATVGAKARETTPSALVGPTVVLLPSSSPRLSHSSSNAKGEKHDGREGTLRLTGQGVGRREQTRRGYLNGTERRMEWASSLSPESEPDSPTHKPRDRDKTDPPPPDPAAGRSPHRLVPPSGAAALGGRGQLLRPLRVGGGLGPLRDGQALLAADRAAARDGHVRRLP